jgi:hypothetical protein
LRLEECFLAPSRHVVGYVQTRPGAPREKAEIEVYEAPIDPVKTVADRAPIEDDDLILGVIVEGRPESPPATTPRRSASAWPWAVTRSTCRCRS